MQGIRVVEGRIETYLVRQVVESALFFLVRRKYLHALRTILFIGILLRYLLIFLILIEIGHIIYLKRSREACIMPQKRALRTHDRVDLAHGLHNLEVVIVELRRHQIYVPHRKVGVEKDDRFHRQLG